MIITRFVKDHRCILKDRDNRDAAAKPVKDVLVRIGVLVDDTDELLEYEVRQEIDRDNPRTEITIT